jgi:hypothetical protein
VDAQTLRGSNLQNKGDNVETIIALGAAFVEQEVLQCKLDFHVLMLETFRGLLTMVEGDDVRVLAKNAMVVEAWKNIIPKVDIWKWQKNSLCCKSIV